MAIVLSCQHHIQTNRVKYVMCRYLPCNNCLDSMLGTIILLMRINSWKTLRLMILNTIYLTDISSKCFVFTMNVVDLSAGLISKPSSKHVLVMIVLFHHETYCYLPPIHSLLALVQEWWQYINPLRQSHQLDTFPRLKYLPFL